MTHPTLSTFVLSNGVLHIGQEPFDRAHESRHPWQNACVQPRTTLTDSSKQISQTASSSSSSFPFSVVTWLTHAIRPGTFLLWLFRICEEYFDFRIISLVIDSESMPHPSIILVYRLVNSAGNSNRKIGTERFFSSSSVSLKLSTITRMTGIFMHKEQQSYSQIPQCQNDSSSRLIERRLQSLQYTDLCLPMYIGGRRLQKRCRRCCSGHTRG
mmetsp:Transcript_1910/g.2716  ORF Transcript_1910/g.2716 Transcript_1910/m.2716 type:complete len:213 (-) Transcript_1910:393-1031(-)